MIKSEGELVIQWYSNLISSSDETGAKISSFRFDSIPADVLGTIGILIEKHNSTWNQSHQVGTFGNGDNFTVMQSYPSSRWKCSKWNSVKNQDRLCCWDEENMTVWSMKSVKSMKRKVWKEENMRKWNNGYIHNIMLLVDSLRPGGIVRAEKCNYKG